MKTPDCPLCGQPPMMIRDVGTRAFCFSEDCLVLTWNPQVSLGENLLRANFIALPDGPGSADCGHD